MVAVPWCTVTLYQYTRAFLVAVYNINEPPVAVRVFFCLVTAIFEFSTIITGAGLLIARTTSYISAFLYLCAATVLALGIAVIAVANAVSSRLEDSASALYVS